MSANLTKRIERLERAVFGVAPDRPARAEHRSDWIACPNMGCQRLSYKAKPACMKCAGYDPRTGEGMPPPAALTS